MNFQSNTDQTENAEQIPMRLKAAATYDAAAGHFDAKPLSFWDRHGRRTVELAKIGPGEHVLDVGCGTGASALPAAVATGANGRVTGADVAEKMLERARAKAQAQNLSNVTFQVADMTAMDFADQSFDAVISVFSVFFATDMESQVAELWRFVRPGGRLAITVWGPDAFEPFASLFAEEVHRQRPDIVFPKRPWERLTNPENLRRLFLDAGASDPAVEMIEDRQTLSDPADLWTIAIGSGFRWEVDQMTPEERAVVRERILARASEMGVTHVESGAICAIAHKRR